MRSKHYSGCPNVYASRATCTWSYPGGGLAYDTRQCPHPPATISLEPHSWRRRKPGLRPCSWALQALRWLPKRLGITFNMWRELPRGWLGLRYPPIPSSPCPPSRTWIQHPKSHIAGWDLVPAALQINGSNPDVSASLATYSGTHPHLGPLYKTH